MEKSLCFHLRCAYINTMLIRLMEATDWRKTCCWTKGLIGCNSMTKIFVWVLQGECYSDNHLPHKFSQFTSLLENSLLTLPAQKTLQITLQRNVDSIQIGIQLSRVIINCLNEQLAKLRSRIMILNHAFICNPNFRPKIWSETSRLNMSV